MQTQVAFKNDSDSEEDKKFDLMNATNFNGTSEPYAMEGHKP